MIVVLAVVQKDIEVAVPYNALSYSRLNKTLNESDNSGAVRATVC